LDNIWKHARRSGNWPYLALLVCIILPLLWIAFSLAVRSGMFGWSGKPTSEELKLLLTFIGGGLATSASIVAALFTREHNARERQRLRLETVIKSLELLPVGARPRVAGVLSTMVLLGQQRIAIRVLEPAWEEGMVDGAAATWLIGQVLTGDGTDGSHLDGDRPDEATINEAALLLASNADQLTDVKTGMYYFPGHFLRRWITKKQLPYRAKDNLLLAMGKMLVSRGKDWWCPNGDLPVWPTTVLVECAEKEPLRVIQSSAAVLLAALHYCFPERLSEYLSHSRLDPILKQAADAAAAHSVPSEYLSLADKIRSDWGHRGQTTG
jgi:hypothetical protein